MAVHKLRDSSRARRLALALEGPQAAAARAALRAEAARIGPRLSAYASGPAQAWADALIGLEASPPAELGWGLVSDHLEVAARTLTRARPDLAAFLRFRHARGQFLRGHLARAEALLRPVLEAVPTTGPVGAHSWTTWPVPGAVLRDDAQTVLSAIRRAQGDVEGATVLAAEVLQRGARSPRARLRGAFHLGAAAQAAGDHPRAETHVAVRDSPG